MIYARVAGRITSTIHHPDFQGRVLLICDKLRPDGAPSGGYVIAVDRVGADAGQTVLILDEGNGARQILGVKDMPVRSVIVGVVDAVDGLNDRWVAGTPPRPGAIAGG